MLLAGYLQCWSLWNCRSWSDSKGKDALRCFQKQLTWTLWTLAIPSSFFSSHLEDGRCHLEFIGDLWLKMQLKNRDANYSQYPCPPPTIWTLKRMCVGIQILRSTFLCMCEYFWSSIGIRKCFCLCCRGTWYLGLHCHISYLSP